MWVMINISTKECDFEIANLYYEKILSLIQLGINAVYSRTKPKFIYFSGNQQ